MKGRVFMKKRIPAFLLCLAVMISALLSGCSARAGEDLMSGVRANAVSADAALDGPEAVAVTDFGVRLFRQSLQDGENVMVSPLSVLCALAMTANGARGETLSQMEAVFGLPLSELNPYLRAWMDTLPSGKKTELDAANAIWFKDSPGFTVEQDFLQANADWYGAGLYKAPFDEGTRRDINDWVDRHTDGMIPAILDEIPQSAVMYLINALAFEAEWEEPYEERQIQDGVFTREDGKAENVKLMYAEEPLYLEDEHAAGFLKYYAGGQYAFVALLPEEGVPVADYAAGLTGERLRDLLSGAWAEEVRTAIPVFESEYSVEMSGILGAMGMTDAFEPGLADLTGIGSSENGPLFINRVLHRTYISVDAKGTKAAAVTVVEPGDGAAPMMEEPKTVYLDRPFIYLIVDCGTDLPIFIGAMMDVNA